MAYPHLRWTLEPGGTSLLELEGLVLRGTGVPDLVVSDATVQITEMTHLAAPGGAVTGVTLPITLAPVAGVPGSYRGVVPPVDVAPRNLVRLVAEINAGGIARRLVLELPVEEWDGRP